MLPMRRRRDRDEGTDMRMDLTIIVRTIRDIIRMWPLFSGTLLKRHPDAR